MLPVTSQKKSVGAEDVDSLQLPHFTRRTLPHLAAGTGALPHDHLPAYGRGWGPKTAGVLGSFAVGAVLSFQQIQKVLR